MTHATIDVTIGGANANAYATIAEADAYHAGHLYATTWEAANDETKTRAIIMATRVLDYSVTWQGSKATDPQALRWPRVGVSNPDGNYTILDDVLPEFLKQGTSEMARLLIDTNRTADSETDGFSLIKLDGLELKVNDATKPNNDVVSDSVWQIIAPYSLDRGSRFGGVATLLRT